MNDAAAIIASFITAILAGAIFWYIERRKSRNVRRQKIETANEKIKSVIQMAMLHDICASQTQPSDKKTSRPFSDVTIFSLRDIENIISARATMDELDPKELKPPAIILRELYYNVCEHAFIKTDDKLFIANKFESMMNRIKNGKNTEEKARLQVYARTPIIIASVITAITALIASISSYQILPYTGNVSFTISVILSMFVLFFAIAIKSSTLFD